MKRLWRRISKPAYCILGSGFFLLTVGILGGMSFHEHLLLGFLGALLAILAFALFAWLGGMME